MKQSVEQPEKEAQSTLLCETAWEVCNQIGGIYTVVRSKSIYMTERWGERYCLIGPYDPDTSPVEFEEGPIAEPFGIAVAKLGEWGIEAHAGTWLVTGRPQVILMRPQSASHKLTEIKYALWEGHGIDSSRADALLDSVMMFGYLVEEFFRTLHAVTDDTTRIVGHFHEWMSGTPLPAIRRDLPRVATVFTTHATLLGRYLAMGSDTYYEWMPFVDWGAEARKYDIFAQATIEWIAAHSAHVFTTVSEVTATECRHLLGREPDLLVPNGLNIQRFVALHEFQNLHRVYKDKIAQFVVGHFFPSYTFDLDKTLYFFTSGRYEYVNKGFNLTIEALARLNYRMKQEKSDTTVVFFIITRAPCRSINPELLRLRAIMDEINRDCEAIKQQVGERLFIAVAQGQWPRFEELVDEYWRLRLRRNLQAWRTRRLPSIVTHDLVDDANDAILAQLRACGLINRAEDPVKVVFHPSFVSSSDALFRMDYDQFVRGCHLGVFPGLYEPWGYTPLECVALGIPTITSDMAGFGSYIMATMPDHEDNGILVARRRHVGFDAAAGELAERMLQVAHHDRRDRIALRNRVEAASVGFDWHTLGRHYDAAHELALARLW